MFELIFLLAGIAGLVLGTHLIIKGALNIAEHYKLSHVFIGLTILAVGTDLPELVININAALHRLGGVETSGLVIGETVGTCMSQIGLTLGIASLFGTSLFLTKRESVREGLMLLGSVALFFLLGLDGKLSRLDGVIFLLVYGVYFIALYTAEKKKAREVKRAPTLRAGWAILSLIAGFAVLIYASDVVVSNGVALAEAWGIAQSFVGAIIIGVSTSLPELSITIGAVTNKASRLSIGNLIGSNIFDILVTLGVGSSISGFLVFRNLLYFDYIFLFITSLIVVAMFFTGRKLTKKEAFLLLGIYGLYFFIKTMSYEGTVIDLVRGLIGS